MSPSNALPEYPRPQLARSKWASLNGVWEFAAVEVDGDDVPTVGDDLERILVPFPVESALSGIMRQEPHMIYRRTFTVPHSWGVGGARGQRLLFHFDAVDFYAQVWVNGTRVGTHKGGYDRFSFDVTDALHTDQSGGSAGEQELVVAVEDLTENGAEQPIGKQRTHPRGLWYTPCSGIWQTVWMEPVDAAHIEWLDMTPDVENATLRWTVHCAGAHGQTIEAIAYDDHRRVGSVTGRAGDELELHLADPTLWSPDNPFLYDLTVRLTGPSGSPADVVRSYFGMRSVGLENVNKVPHIVLNGEFTFQLSTLQQGYWPDGIYTAPTDEALKFDLEQAKRLGFNTVRKHVKIEPDRWYYWADRLGLFVWQDMPSMDIHRRSCDDVPSDAAQREFLSELKQVIDQHRSHPCITMWIPFNESWGPFDPAGVVQRIKDWDPSRLVDAMSGSNVGCAIGGDDGDVLDLHNLGRVWPGPTPQPDDGRASVIGEFGAYGLAVEGHEWDPGNSNPNVRMPDAETLTSTYVDTMHEMERFIERCGLSAGNYNLFADVERQVNGLFTYDRKVLKPDARQVRKANLGVIAASGKASNPTPPPPGTPGLTGVGFWPFDQSSGNTAPDASDHGHTARLVNDPQWTTGHTGKALHFNGRNQWVDTGESILDTTGDFSVAAWVQLDNTNGFQTVVSQDGSRTSEFFLQYSGADNRFAFTLPHRRALAKQPPETGRWYHLTGVRDAYNSKTKLYVDGRLESKISYCPGQAAKGNTVIGRAKFGGNSVDFWTGLIDQVHIYDRALSSAEVKELYQSGK